MVREVILTLTSCFPSDWQDDDGERDVTTYRVLILEKSSVQITDLSPDTTYMFRVQAVSPEGAAGSYSPEHQFHTSPLGKIRAS